MSKVRILLEPSDARVLKRLAAQAVASLASAEDPSKEMPAEERARLLDHRDAMHRIVEAVGAGQRKLASHTLR